MIPDLQSPSQRFWLNCPCRYSPTGEKWMSLYEETTSMLQKVFERGTRSSSSRSLASPRLNGCRQPCGQRGRSLVVSTGYSRRTLSKQSGPGGRAVPIASEFGRGPTLDQVQAVLDGSEGPAGKDHLPGPERDIHGRRGQPSRDLPLLQEEGDVHRPRLDLGHRWHGASGQTAGASTTRSAIQARPWVASTVPIRWRYRRTYGTSLRRGRARFTAPFWTSTPGGRPSTSTLPGGTRTRRRCPLPRSVALRKAVSMALEEGLENRYRRHAEPPRSSDGLRSLGLESSPTRGSSPTRSA